MLQSTQSNYIIRSKDDDLYHDGVKGMKWGVRKDDIKAKRKDLRKSIKKATKEINSKLHSGTLMSPKTYANMKRKFERDELNIMLSDLMDQYRDLKISELKYKGKDIPDRFPNLFDPEYMSITDALDYPVIAIGSEWYYPIDMGKGKTSTGHFTYRTY